MKKLFLIIPIVIALSLMIIPYVVYFDNFTMYQNSDSMYPAILPGDLLIVEYSEINDVAVDDIIAFETHSEGVEVLVRRVIDASFGSDGRFGVDTQGDDEDFHDPWTIYSDGYIGKVVEINPPIGIITLSNYFIFPLVIIIVICAALFARELIPKKGMEIEELHCLRCDNRWHPRVINGETKIPSTCPKKECRSPYWKTPRKSDQ